MWREQGGETSQPLPLSQLDTPDTRLLLALLERALIVAERVDSARGRVLPDDTQLPSVMSRGTDLAARINELTLRLRMEVHGPPGRE